MLVILNFNFIYPHSTEKEELTLKCASLSTVSYYNIIIIHGFRFTLYLVVGNGRQAEILEPYV